MPNFRIVYVLAGLGMVIIFLGVKVMVYNAGRSSYFILTLEEIVVRETIDLLIVSNNNADHIGGESEVATDIRVKNLVY